LFFKKRRCIIMSVAERVRRSELWAVRA